MVKNWLRVAEARSGLLEGRGGEAGIHSWAQNSRRGPRSQLCSYQFILAAKIYSQSTLAGGGWKRFFQESSDPHRGLYNVAVV